MLLILLLLITIVVLVSDQTMVSVLGFILGFLLLLSYIKPPPNILPVPSNAGPYRVYYIRARWQDEFAYKIGRTKNTLQKRFSGYNGLYREIHSFYFNDYEEHLTYERYLQKKHDEYNIDACYALGPDGHTEWFNRDVLELDPESPECKAKKQVEKLKRIQGRKNRRKAGDTLWWIPPEIRNHLSFDRDERRLRKKLKSENSNQSELNDKQSLFFKRAFKKTYSAKENAVALAEIEANVSKLNDSFKQLDEKLNPTYSGLGQLPNDYRERFLEQKRAWEKNYQQSWQRNHEKAAISELWLETLLERRSTEEAFNYRIKEYSSPDFKCPVCSLKYVLKYNPDTVSTLPPYFYDSKINPYKLAAIHECDNCGCELAISCNINSKSDKQFSALINDHFQDRISNQFHQLIYSSKYDEEANEELKKEYWDLRLKHAEIEDNYEEKCNNASVQFISQNKSIENDISDKEDSIRNILKSYNVKERYKYRDHISDKTVVKNIEQLELEIVRLYRNTKRPTIYQSCASTPSEREVKNRVYELQSRPSLTALELLT